MISRYTREEMGALWDERSKYKFWLEVELAVCEELAGQGKIPKDSWKKLQTKAKALIAEGGVDPDRVAFHEKTTRHDVIAFTTAVAEKIGEEARYIHYGLTSSDVVDTALSLQVQASRKILMVGVARMKAALKKLAVTWKTLPTIGRSHGIFAEPTSFGLKFLGFYSEILRCEERLNRAFSELEYGKLSGAVGVNSHFGPEFEETTLKRMGLKRELVSTQVIPRDRHAELFQAVALTGAAIERIAIELRHLQRSEVAEVMEGFKAGQKGSSAMPHKRNPISSENLTGIARLLRSHAAASIENIALWHERDISHSSVERVIFPDALILLDYSLHRMSDVLDGLVVNEARVKENLEKAGGTVYSGHTLLALVEAGVSREDAYAWIQSCAMASFSGKGDFKALLLAHPEISAKLGREAIEKLGSNQYQLRNVEAIFESVLR